MTHRIPRWFARAPIPLYRYGAGALFGRRIAMLQHRGRLSGKPRYVMLEVVGHEDDGLTVVSGYGRSAQWFRNVEADPQVRVWTGRRRAVPARAEILGPDESRQRLQRYVDQHPKSAASLGRMLGIDDLTTGTALPADVAARLPLVAIRYADGPS